jgi:hypothetical protein
MLIKLSDRNAVLLQQTVPMVMHVTVTGVTAGIITVITQLPIQEHLRRDAVL